MFRVVIYANWTKCCNNWVKYFKKIFPDPRREKWLTIYHKCTRKFKLMQYHNTAVWKKIYMLWVCSDNLHWNWQLCPTNSFVKLWILVRFGHRKYVPCEFSGFAKEHPLHSSETHPHPVFFTALMLLYTVCNYAHNIFPNLFWIVKKIQFQLIRPLSVSIMVQKLTLPVQYTNMYTMDLQCRFILQ